MHKCIKHNVMASYKTVMMKIGFIDAVLFSFEFTKRLFLWRIKKIVSKKEEKTQIVSNSTRISCVFMQSTQYAYNSRIYRLMSCMVQPCTVRPRVQRGELTCLFFFDWSKAYDRVMHQAFLARLAYKGVTGKLWRLIDALYQRYSVRACIAGCQSMPLVADCGVAQGCPLSPFLYAIFIDGLLDSVHSECVDSGLLAGASPLVLQAYADDKCRGLFQPPGHATNPSRNETLR
jgi:hypothetical protein